MHIALQRLCEKAMRTNGRFMTMFDPNDSHEPWRVKFFPDCHDDAHYWANGKNLDDCINSVINEMDGF